MKILVSEDEPVTRNIIKKTLESWGYEVTAVETSEEAYMAFSKGGIEFVILDWMMPTKMQGIDLVKLIRASEGGDYAYIIMLTAKGQREDIIRGISEGVDDYVLKPFDKQELKVRVRLGQKILNLKKENTELKQEVSELSILSTMDPVTKIFNRRTILAKIQGEIDNLKVKSLPLSIILLSIENLKKIQSVYSYKIADTVTIDLIRRVNAHLTEVDYPGRFSDDQFIIVMPGTYIQSCNITSRNIQNSLEDKPFTIKNNLKINLETTVGTAYSSPDQPEDAETLILQASYKIRRMEFAGDKKKQSLDS